MQHVDILPIFQTSHLCTITSKKVSYGTHLNNLPDCMKTVHNFIQKIPV